MDTWQSQISRRGAIVAIAALAATLLGVAVVVGSASSPSTLSDAAAALKMPPEYVQINADLRGEPLGWFGDYPTITRLFVSPLSEGSVCAQLDQLLTDSGAFVRSNKPSADGCLIGGSMSGYALLAQVRTAATFSDFAKLSDPHLLPLPEDARSTVLISWKDAR